MSQFFLNYFDGQLINPVDSMTLENKRSGVKYREDTLTASLPHRKCKENLVILVFTKWTVLLCIFAGLAPCNHPALRKYAGLVAKLLIYVR